MQPVLPPPFTHMWPRCASSRPSSKLASLNACGVSCGGQGTGRGHGRGLRDEAGKAGGRQREGRSGARAYATLLALPYTTMRRPMVLLVERSQPASPVSRRLCVHDKKKRGFQNEKS